MTQQRKDQPTNRPGQRDDANPQPKGPNRSQRENSTPSRSRDVETDNVIDATDRDTERNSF